MPAESPTRFVMVPARRSDEPTARKRARRILGALFLAAGLSVIAVFFAVAKGRSGTDLSAVDPKGRDIAYTAAVNFVAGAYQNVPHATTYKPDDAVGGTANGTPGGLPTTSVPLSYQSLSWVGFTPEHFGSSKSGITNFEIHHFLVVLGKAGTTPAPSSAPGSTAPAGSPKVAPSPSGDVAPGSTAPAGSPKVAPSPSGDVAPGSTAPAGSPTDPPSSSGDVAKARAANVLQLDVPILITPEGPRLAAQPAFSVWQGGAGGATGTGDYTNYSRLVTDVSSAAQNQVAAWAKAYVTGDSAGLLTLTGDQNSHHRYIGLGGFTLPGSPDAVQILSAIKASKGQLIVRVRVLLARAADGGTVSKGGDTDSRFVTFADFDLLVGAPTGARPPVLAWGPAGSAAELEPYSNALNS